MKPIKGVNLSGGEHGGNNRPGRINWDYVYPSVEQVKWYAKNGIRLIRLPFLSCRIIRNGAIYKPEVDAIMLVVDTADRLGVKVVLDMHEYARQDDEVTPLTTSSADLAAFRKKWRMIAPQFRSRGNVIYGLMNEPHDQTPEDWVTIALAGLSGIREVAPTHIVMIMGAYWGAADGFVDLNAEALERITDPNVIIEVHQYFDGKGGKPENGWRAIAGKGASSLAAVTKWARENGRRLFLGEVGFTADAGDMKEGQDALNMVFDNEDVWYGVALWCGSIRYAGRTDRPFSIEPDNYTTATVKPQHQLLISY